MTDKSPAEQVGAITKLAVGELDLVHVGELAIAEAERLWALDVFDPAITDERDAACRCKAIIGDIVAANGWHDKVPYKGDGYVQWCGMFAGDCWRKAGLDPRVLAVFWASTIRLDTWARYQPFNEHANSKPAEGPYRMIVDLDEHSRGPVRFPDGSPPRSGDVLLLGPIAFPNGKRALPCGEHVCLVKSYDESTHTFDTLEGNGVGIGPQGNRMQGIVRGRRELGLLPGQPPTVYHARRLIRPAPHDLIAC